MAGNEVTVIYHLLAKHDPENDDEVRRYSCSECTDDVFNVNVHAQVAHNTLHFETIVDTEKVVEHDPPFHPCGVMGCTFEPHTGKHSWQLINNGEFTR